MPDELPLAPAEDLATILPDLVRKTDCDGWQPMRGPLHCRGCTIYFLRSPDFRLPGIVLKAFPQEPPERRLMKRLAAMHEAGATLHAAATAEFAVPEPVTLIRKWRVLGMEFIAAPRSNGLLTASLLSPAKRDEVIAKSAGWLRWFHTRSEMDVRQFDASLHLAALAKMTSQLPATDPFLSKCLRLAENVTAEMDGQPFHHAAIHGDFTPFNLFIDGGRTIGFDYQAKGMRPVSADICRYLLYLGMYHPLPARAAELREFGCRQRDSEVFLDAYGGGPDLTGNPLWPGLHFLEVVRRIASLTLLREKGRSRPLRLVEMALLRRNAAQLMKTLAR